MDVNQEDELKAYLMSSDHQFRELVEQHAQLKKQLEAIEAKPHLSLEDEDHEHAIKKQKLRLKDLINQAMLQHRTLLA